MKRTGRVIFFNCAIITSLCFLLFYCTVVSCEGIGNCVNSTGIPLPRYCCRLVNQTSTVVCSNTACPQGYYASTSLCGAFNFTFSQNITAVTFCCACDGSCLNCLAVGPSDCYQCKTGYSLQTDSALTGRCVELDADSEPQTTFLAGLIGLGLSVPLLIVAIVLIIVRRRRRNSKRNHDQVQCKISVIGCEDSTTVSKKHLTPRPDGSSEIDDSTIDSRETCMSSCTSKSSESNRTDLSQHTFTLSRGFYIYDVGYFSSSRDISEDGNSLEAEAGGSCKELSLDTLSHQSLGESHQQVIVEADIEHFGQRQRQETQTRSSSKSTWSGRSEDADSYVYRNFAYDQREPLDWFLSNNTLASYETTTSTQTDSPDMYEDIPRFCPDWQFSETVTAKGGTLKGEHSDVRLEIASKATGKDSIVVKGAVCTDLDVVHKNFQLQEDEFIVTPVVEYQANGGNFRFEKPVRIVLPHFLPPNFAQSKIRAYECCRSATGDWKVNQLQLEDRSNAGAKNGHQQVPGVFYFAEKNEIHVLTDHFSVYFCTDCEKEFTPPELFLKVFTKFTDEGSEAQVDVRLDIWDTRLTIQDFPNGVYGHDTVNQRGMVQVDTKILGAVARQLLDTATLKVSLDLLRASDRELWIHTARSNGDFLYPPDMKLDLKSLVPCACKTRIPRRVDWQLCSAPNKAPADSCRCVLDAAYVTKDGNDVTTHEKVTIDFKAEKNMVDGLKKLDTPARRGRPPLIHRIQNNLTPTADPADTQLKQLVEPPDSLTLTLENASLGSQSEDEGAVGGSPSSATSISSARNVFICDQFNMYNGGRQRSSTGRRSGSSSDGSLTSPGVPPSGASNEAFEVLTPPPTQVSNADETAGPSYPHG